MRRVLAVTSGRADASPIQPVVRAIQGCACINLYLGSSTPYIMAAQAITEVGVSIATHSPDVVLLLGDRYETLATALAATIAKVPIAHIHGGEASFGSFDNQIRDAISKLAHIHFVAAEPFKGRLIAIGEDPERIHVVGAPGLDNLVDLPPRKPEKYFVATYHPPTLGEPGGIHALIEALDRFPDYDVIWTGVNNDPGRDEIFDILREKDIRSYSPRDYLLACRNAAAVVGNSSSGIIEAPTLGVPTVNVGPRQDGRLKAMSVRDCKEDVDDIVGAINWAISITLERWFKNPYGGPGASQKIADILATAEIEMVKSW